jgi:hypothetical protein
LSVRRPPGLRLEGGAKRILLEAASTERDEDHQQRGDIELR